MSHDSIFEAHRRGDVQGLYRWPSTLESVRAMRTSAGQARDVVVDVLRDRLTGGDEEEVSSLEALARGAVCVVAGQQPGLFGGPLLSTLKAATAVRLARMLREEHGLDAVPVFWNASEDHDFDEADRVFLPVDDGAATRLFHSGVEGAGRSLDRVPSDARFEDVLEHEPGLAPDAPSAGETFGAWMTRLVRSRFAGTGLVVVEPTWFHDVLDAGFFDDVRARDEALRTALAEGRERIRDAGFEPRLSLAEDASWLFVSSSAGRRRLRRDEDPREQDGELSCSAPIRPLAQQHLLPVVAQVCGPAEGSYLAEVQGMFPVLGLEAPVLWPRAHAVLLSETEDRIRTEWNVSTAEALAGRWPVALEELVSIPAELGRRERRAREKAIRRENVGLFRARTRLKERVHPRGRPQDRVYPLGVFGAWPREYLMRRILEEIDPLDPSTRIIVLEDAKRT